MRLLLSLLFICTLNSAHADTDPCTSVQRSITTDQQDIVLSAGIDYLELSVSQVLAMKLDNYVSWKEQQKGCLANVLHNTNLSITYLNSKQELCASTATIHRKDHFVVKAGGETSTEYKKPIYTESCVSPGAIESEKIKTCLSQVCPYNKPKLFRDYYDSCRCKPFLSMIQAKDTGDLYKDFFDPSKTFLKPAGLFTPFK